MRKVTSYKNDYLFGELSEENFINFYTKLNEKNNIIILKVGYEETIEETIEKILETDLFTNKQKYIVNNIIVNKIKDNYNKMIKINRKNTFFDRYDTTALNLVEDKYKNLFNEEGNINLNFRTQILGIDLIILKEVLTYDAEITFLELKSFKSVAEMYKKLGLEFFSKFSENDKKIGYSFSMLSDILVYRQDINEDITKENSKELRLEIDRKRLRKEDDNTYTYFNVFKNFDFLNDSVNYCNLLKDGFYFHTAKTNNYVSCFLNIEYSYFKNSLIRQYKYKNKEIIKL